MMGSPGNEATQVYSSYNDTHTQKKSQGTSYTLVSKWQIGPIELPTNLLVLKRNCQETALHE